jgi:Zn-dependent peptidase ImmA (M78 family)
MPTEEALGFSVAEDGKHAIVVNSADDFIGRRIFTLFHEYAHVLLASPGVCLPDEGQVTKSGGVEMFCNRFAAAFLIPHTETETLSQSIHDSDVANAAQRCASRYHVSRFVVLGRMRRFDLIPEKTYVELARRWSATDHRRKVRKGGRAESTVEKCIRQRGRRLAKSVLEASERNLITSADAIRFLHVKLNDLGEIQKKVKSKSV